MKKQRLRRVMKYSMITAIILSVVGLFFNQSCSSVTYSTEDIEMEKIHTSPQYNDGKFANKVVWEEPGLLDWFPMMWEFMFADGQRSPEGEVPRVDADLTHFNQKDRNHLSATWVGHSSLLINIDGYKILTDPVYEKKVSLVGPTRYNGEVPLDMNQLMGIDVVIVSHNHYDHLNKRSIEFLKDRAKLFIVPLMVGAQLESWGVPKDKIVELDWWDEYRVNDDLLIACTPAQHFSGRSMTDRNATLWASFVIQGPEHKVYFSGDSGYFDGFKAIGEKYGPFDIAFLETGAYNERWHPIHMFPEENVQAAVDLGCTVLHPIHWGTFNLSLHSWFDPMDRVTAEAERLGVTVVTPIVGETTVFGEYLPQSRWWETVALAEVE